MCSMYMYLYLIVGLWEYVLQWNLGMFGGYHFVCCREAISEVILEVPCPCKYTTLNIVWVANVTSQTGSGYSLIKT